MSISANTFQNLENEFGQLSVVNVENGMHTIGTITRADQDSIPTSIHMWREVPPGWNKMDTLVERANFGTDEEFLNAVATHHEAIYFADIRDSGLNDQEEGRWKFAATREA